MKTVYHHIKAPVRTVLLALIVSIMGLAAVQAGENHPLHAFIGEWQSNGDAFGRPAISTIRWQPVLGDKFIHLEYRIQAKQGHGLSHMFSGTAYYRHAGENGFHAFWADSEGSLHPVTATLEATTLTAHWGTPTSEQGRTRYHIKPDGSMLVTDWVQANGGWQQFNENTYVRLQPQVTDSTQPQKEQTMEKVTGIGGVFFRANDPTATARWYKDNLGIDLPPTDYAMRPWQQEAGPTVFSAFPHNSDYFGETSQQWMINFRVNDLDAMVAQLRKGGTAVEVDPTTYPNGRFARTADPAGTPIQLWEPARP